MIFHLLYFFGKWIIGGALVILGFRFGIAVEAQNWRSHGDELYRRRVLESNGCRYLVFREEDYLQRTGGRINERLGD